MRHELTSCTGLHACVCACAIIALRVTPELPPIVPSVAGDEQSDGGDDELTSVWPQSSRRSSLTVLRSLSTHINKHHVHQYKEKEKGKL